MAGTRRVHTPTLLQLEAVECGAAALGIILAHHGRHVPLPELRQRCGVSLDGSRAAQIVRAARAYGLEAKGLMRTPEALRELKPPYVIFWQFNHFLVVEGITSGAVYLNDPAVGHRIISHEDFDSSFTGVVLQMEPGPEFKKAGKPPSVISALVSRLGGHIGTLVLCLIAGILLALPDLATAVLTTVFIDQVLIAGRTDWLRPVVSLLFATVVVQVGLKWLELTWLRKLLLDLTARLSGQFLWHLLRLPMPFYSARFAGEISYRAQLTQNVAEILSGKLTNAGIAVFSMILYGAVMLSVSPGLTLLGTGFAVISFVALRMAHRQRVEANLRRAQDRGKAAGAAIVGLQSIEPLKASGLEDGFFSRWAGYATRAEQAHQDLESLNVNLGVLPTMLEGFAMAAIWLVGGLQIISGQLTLGLLVAFNMLMHRFLAPVNELVKLSGSMQEVMADMHRLDDVLKCEPMVIEPPRPEDAEKSENLVRLNGKIEVDHLTFGYSPVDGPLLQDLSLQANPGQWISLVGRTGSGKSTLSALLTGLLTPWSGEIRFDGVERTKIEPLQLALSIAHVDQNIVLFEGTIRDNLTLWDSTVPEDRLWQACRDAEIDDLVKSLPGGLDSVLPEGGLSLSGGQRQRIEIARALVNDPSILILDEATSSLDPEVEWAIFRNLRRRGCTCVLVAHRLSTIRDADEILVLDQGRLIERGTHVQLISASGPYAELIAGEES